MIVKHVESLDGAPVCRGTVVIIKTYRENCFGLIRCIKPWMSQIPIEGDRPYNPGDLTISKNTSPGLFLYWEPVNLIIYSEKEELQRGCLVFVKSQNIVGSLDRIEGNFCYLVSNSTPYEINKVKKVLLTEKQIHVANMDPFFDGTIKDGDQVFIRLTNDDKDFLIKNLFNNFFIRNCCDIKNENKTILTEESQSRSTVYKKRYFIYSMLNAKVTDQIMISWSYLITSGCYPNRLKINSHHNQQLSTLTEVKNIHDIKDFFVDEIKVIEDKVNYLTDTDK